VSAGGGARERRWLRPLGLLAVALALGVGQPSLVLVVTFALLVILAPGGGVVPLLVSAIAFAIAFAGEPTGGIWYLDRGWAILVGGWFAAASWEWPERPFFQRALVAVAGGSGCAALLLLGMGGWPGAERLVMGRIEAGVAAATGVVAGIAGSGPDAGVVETMQRAAEVQVVLFPALLALSTCASLGVAWWLYVRLTTGSDAGLGALRGFRFPDPLMWVLIAGLALVLLAGWSVGWGRVGSNMAVFMGGLYVLRGAGVLLFLAGGMTYLGGIALLVGLVLAGPVLAAGALVVGMGDSWFDLRGRWPGNRTAD
jgi:hypothetical protein